MCGRYSLAAELNEIRLTFDADSRPGLRYASRYNIAPSYRAGSEPLTVTASAKGSQELMAARFWFIPPFWAQPLAELPTTFNARAETLAKRPFFREAFRASRCLVPATGWREFKPEGGRKQPFHFHRGGGLFAFAGLFSSWVAPDGERVASFAIITVPPHRVAAPIHDRMPLVLAPSLYLRWLHEKGEPESLLREATAWSLEDPLLSVYASNPAGNNVRVEGPEVIAKSP
jgi:putative SOS response-associated peptidase YedK